MPIQTRGRGMGTIVCWCALYIKYSSIFFVISNSEITPSRNGRMAEKFGGVRPVISFADAPTAIVSWVRLLTTTHEGSLITMPLPRTFTSVFAVPRSIPISSEKKPINQLKGLAANSYSYKRYTKIKKNYTIALFSQDPQGAGVGESVVLWIRDSWAVNRKHWFIV